MGSGRFLRVTMAPVVPGHDGILDTGGLSSSMTGAHTARQNPVAWDKARVRPGGPGLELNRDLDPEDSTRLRQVGWLVSYLGVVELPGHVDLGANDTVGSLDHGLEQSGVGAGGKLAGDRYDAGVDRDIEQGRVEEQEATES